MSPQRIQRHRTPGWRMPEGAVYVGRPSPFGNPFTVNGAREAGYIGTDAELAAMCVAEYRAWVRGTDPIHRRDWYLSDAGRSYDRVEVRARLHELAGRDLVCWCATDRPCHADVLIELSSAAPGLAAMDVAGADVHPDPAAPATTT